MERQRKTRRSVLIVGSVLILLSLIFWRPLQHDCFVYFLLRSEAPPEKALSTAVQQAGNPAALLLRLWNTQRIPHRQFVLAHLARTLSTNPHLCRSLELVLLDATADPDITARESAFAILAAMMHPQLRPLALSQLCDPDPAARLIALQALRHIANSNDVPVAMRLLADPEPRVVVAAALLLRQATGFDSGIRTSLALPQFTGIDTNPPPPPDLSAISHGVQRWREWWVAHRAEFPSAPAASATLTHEPLRATTDFTLLDSAGKATRLSRFRGKMVLLAFWSPGAPASLDDAPALKNLQRQYHDTLTVLGVCVPAAPSCAGEDDGHQHAEHHHNASVSAMTGPEHLGCVAQEAATRLHLNYPVLMDTSAELASRFRIEDLPAYVLIDTHGMIQRRLVGFRTESALAATVAEVFNVNSLQASAR